MSGFPASHFCKRCNQETPHSEVLVRKPSRYDTDKTILGTLKLWAHTLINGGHYYDMDRYVTCKECGHNTKRKTTGEKNLNRHKKPSFDARFFFYLLELTLVILSLYSPRFLP